MSLNSTLESLPELPEAGADGETPVTAEPPAAVPDAAKVDYGAAAESLMTIAIGVSGLSGSMVDLAAATRRNADGAEAAASNAESGGLLFRDAMASIESVSGALNSTEKSVVEVREHVEKIGAVIDNVRTIATQTRLLSLNAAIEAARASDERSAAFKVVAQEVRTLSDRTSTLASTVHTLLRQLRQVSDASGELVSNTRGRVDEGIKKVGAVGATIAKFGEVTREIVESSRRTAGELDANVAKAEDLSRDLNMNAVQIAGG